MDSILQRLPDVVVGLLDPWIFMWMAISFLPSTVLRLFRAREFATLLSISAVQAAWWNDFWAWAGPQVRATAERRVVPLLSGRVRQGRIIQSDGDEIDNRSHENNNSDGKFGQGHPGVGGTVLEVGPGTGMWVSLFSAHAETSQPAQPSFQAGTVRSRKGVGSSERVTRVWGVEPNLGAHAELRRRAAEAGLQNIYEVVSLGIEELSKDKRIAPGSVDCIVSVLCLCGIPDPERNIQELYQYLKPGGRMYVYEHVAAKTWGMYFYQGLANLLWPHFLNGCQLRRDTETWLRAAGPWSDVDLAQPVDEAWHACAPHILGILTK